MKATGIVRHVDELGRTVLPMKIKKTLGINNGDALEIFVERDLIILKKYQPSCIFCSSNEGVITYKEKLVCSDCIESIIKK